MKTALKSVQAYFRSAKVLWNYLSSRNELTQEVTEQYPDPISSRTADDLPPRSRGLLFNDIDRCTGCGDCKKICPTNCIELKTEEGAENSKLWVAVFDVDFSKCLFCGLCVEVCVPNSLVHTRQYEGSVYKSKDLVANFGRGFVTPQQKSKWARIRQTKEQEW